MQQLGNIDFVESQVRRIAAEASTVGVPMQSASSPSTAPTDTHHHIAKDVTKHLFLGEWLANHSSDPALKVLSFLYETVTVGAYKERQDFLPHLKQHLHARIHDSDPLYDRNHYKDLIIQDGILYCRKNLGGSIIAR